MKIKNYDEKKEYKMNKGEAYLLSFLIPVISMFMILLCRGAYPFGEKCFLRTDMYHQYAPFFSEMLEKIRHGGSFSYSWDIGLGVNFLSLAGYYLSSPLNILMIFCPENHVIEFMTLIIIIKLGLSGLFFSLYICRRGDRDPFNALIFSIFYAMSAYICAYSWNIMWLDCIYLFPICIMGLEDILNGKSPNIYFLALSLSIISNYYIAIMVCLFIAIYFILLIIIKIIDKEEDILNIVIKFVFYSLLAGGIAAFILLPEIMALSGTASADSTFPKNITEYFHVFDIFERHMMLVKTENGLKHWPNIYCGSLIFITVPLYFMNEKIAFKEKFINLSLLMFLILGFSINVLNYIWHGLHYPNSLPCRQSFIYIFLILKISSDVLNERKNISKNRIFKVLLLFLIYIVIAAKLSENKEIKMSSYILTTIFLMIYFILLVLEKKRGRDYILTFIILTVSSIEALINLSYTSVPVTSRTAYIRDNDDIKSLIRENNKIDKGFYRYDRIENKTKNDGAWLHYKSASNFSSTAYADMSHFYKKIGMESSTNAYCVRGADPFSKMLLGIKYDIYNYEIENPEEKNLSCVLSEGESFLYRRKYTLPPAFLVDFDIFKNWNTKFLTPYLNQNSLSESYGIDRLLIEKLGTFEGNTYNYTVDEAGEYFAYINNKDIKDVTVSIDGSANNYDHIDRGYLIDLGYLETGVNLNVSSDKYDDTIDCNIYRFNYSGLEELYKILSKNPFNLLTYSDGYMKGNVDILKSQVLMFSIPYDKGWSAYVDGEKAEIFKILDGFLALSLPPGEHEITIKYTVPGLKMGVIISLISLIIFAFINQKNILGYFRRKLGKNILPKTIEDSDEIDDIELIIEE